MTCVTTDNEIEEASKKAINALFGSNIQNFNVREVFPYSSGQIATKANSTEIQSKDSWDIQVTFLLDNIQYTVDLLIREKDGQVSYVRVIDTMTPI
ncbi:MAG TPA: hypothetical protein VN703_08160 [Candidatus Sulfopaludibacter sp.]|jgi:hypothetical protein|nr:hypothetical protein [Candidatus Sulfopaludibacter sp.]